MQLLFEKLDIYSQSDIYPYHMPGHKRNGWGALPAELYQRDITEIDGFDNLHQPEGILRELQEKAASLYGAEESFYLVNGSSCGVLSAVSAVLPRGGHLLMARNCHRSAYHAVYLRNLFVSYLWPDVLTQYDIFDAVTPEQVRDALEEEPNIGAVLVVSPTYEGRIADIRGIAEAAHQKGIPLIVDEAHGAHLGFSPKVHENSCRLDADIVIHSVHKTLPALTQTALLHVNGKLVDRALLKRFLHIYQSSSPSYLLMASIDNALNYMECDGEAAFAVFKARYCKLLDSLAICRRLQFIPFRQEKQDLGKLVISVKNTDISGRQLYDILLNKYHLQMEMAARSYVLAMFTLNDREEGYNRLRDALLEIDGQLASGSAMDPETRSEPSVSVRDLEAAESLFADVHDKRVQKRQLAAAWDHEAEERPLNDAVGCCAGEFLNLYPPGVPLLVPGEKITGELIQKIQDWMELGLNLQGIIMKEEGPFIRVMRSEDGKSDW